MAGLATLPRRRPELILKPGGEPGRYVVKDPRAAAYYEIGEEEHFLLNQFDGERTAEAVQKAFEARFSEPLDDADLDAFVEAARRQGFVGDAAPPKKKRQSILFWRRSIWDPDSFFDRVEPHLRYFWTRGFLILSAASIVLAVLVLWANRGEIVPSALGALRWETLFWGWLVLLGITAAHECAHGLTCKHYGGDVKEIGFLLMYFMPCFYCNVSDAWLFPEKKKRLWVTLAGGYFELFLWALAVFVWRVTATDTLVNYLAFLVLAVSGAESFFNFNPLIKLDGYYLLSDWKEIPNLRERSMKRVKAHLRRILWGAPAPEPHSKGRFLTGFGLSSLLFTCFFLTVMLGGLVAWLGESLGPVGLVAVAALAVPAFLGIFRGVFAGEVTAMILKRRKRTLVWLGLLTALAAVLIFVNVDEYAGGSFTVRATVREEIRSPVAGFVRAIQTKEGDRIATGHVIARLEVPDLKSRLDQKRAEVRHEKAQLALLRSGARPEQIAQQRKRVDRAVRWLARARDDLERLKKTLAEELSALDERVAEARAVGAARESDYNEMYTLYSENVASHQELEKAELARRVARAQLARTRADRRVRHVKGTIVAEDEIARREKELAEERAALALLEAGARPEEITAQQARIECLLAKIRHLERLQAKLEIRSTVAGVVVTPRLKQMCGQYVREGDLICVVEDPSSQEVAIALKEEKLQRVEVGQWVRMKARALPFETLEGRVTCIAPVAKEDKAQSTVVVSCSVNGSAPVLRTSMSGHARICTGRRSVGAIVADRMMRLLRTEFWW
jgi:multidrug resistance efflux pump